MNVVDGSHKFLEVFAGQRLLEALVLYDDLEELPALGEFHHQIEILLRLNYLIQLNYIRMMYLFEYLDFSGYAFHVLLLLNARLLENLYRHLFELWIIILVVTFSPVSM